MNIKQKIILITVMIISVIAIVFINNWSNKRAESEGIRLYASALELYKAQDWNEAYKTFSKVPRISSLKAPAVYRQAKCAENLQHSKTAKRHYWQLIHNYQNFPITSGIKYMFAKNIFDNSPKKSKRYFNEIVKKYPKSEYAIASRYYLGLIELMDLQKEKNPTRIALDMQKAEEYFKSYLEDAPAGRYAVPSINRILEINNQVNLNPATALVIAKSYYSLGQFKLAEKYLAKTDAKKSWCDLVKNYYELRNFPKVKEFTEKGLQYYSSNVESKDLYKAVDLYLQSYSGNNRVLAINYLYELSHGKMGEDYLMYLTCRNSSSDVKNACYMNLYNNFPKGQFAADALSNVFFNMIKEGRYNSAKKYGLDHLNKYPNVNSTPFVLFWMGKAEEKTKRYEESRFYYKKVLNEYPDSYYAYRAYVDMHRINPPLFASNLSEDKPVVFPYLHSKDGDMVVKLALLKDYALVNELCKNDKFVQSWLLYEKGEFNKSVVMARDAMEKLNKKPPKEDLRWRLVYPLHYYDYAKEYMLNNNPILLMAIIKEESHFDPKAVSIVGAKGLMQLMPQTANEVKTSYNLAFADPNYLFNPKINIQLGSLYFSQLKKQNDGSDFYAVLSYNGGIGKVKSWKNSISSTDRDYFLEQIPYPETQNYLKKVYKAYWNYARIYADEF